MTNALDHAKNPPTANVVRSKELKSFIAAGKICSKTSSVGMSEDENKPNLVTSFIH